MTAWGIARVGVFVTSEPQGSFHIAWRLDSTEDKRVAVKWNAILTWIGKSMSYSVIIKSQNIETWKAFY